MAGQGRDILTGRFSRKTGFEQRLVANLVGPQDSTASILWTVLQRSAPMFASIAQEMVKRNETLRAAPTTSSPASPTTDL